MVGNSSRWWLIVENYRVMESGGQKWTTVTDGGWLWKDVENVVRWWTEILEPFGKRSPELPKVERMWGASACITLNSYVKLQNVTCGHRWDSLLPSRFLWESSRTGVASRRYRTPSRSLLPIASCPVSNWTPNP